MLLGKCYRVPTRTLNEHHFFHDNALFVLFIQDKDLNTG